MSDDLLYKVKQITVESHGFMFPIKKEIELIKRRLKLLGFICIVYSRANHGDVYLSIKINII